MDILLTSVLSGTFPMINAMYGSAWMLGKCLHLLKEIDLGRPLLKIFNNLGTGSMELQVLYQGNASLFRDVET